MYRERARTLIIGLVAGLALPAVASAHEVYVLTKEQWQTGVVANAIDLWRPLWEPQNFGLVVTIAIAAIVTIFVVTNFWSTKTGQALDSKLQNLNEPARLLMRITIAVAILLGTRLGTVFGPEISLLALPFDSVLAPIMYMLSALLLIGWMTELVALALIAIFGMVFVEYGVYAFTYVHYLGVFIAFLCFGGGWYAIDRQRISKMRSEAEALIVRVAYGLSFVYTAITIKFLHPAIFLEVINRYSLTSYQMFFPSDPVLVALGAAIVELVCGLFIIIGFQTRLVLSFMLFYLTLSVLFFSEALWPHLLLFGVTFYLIANNGGRLSVDHWLGSQLIRLKKDAK